MQVLSSPRIATLNNQKAVLKVGFDELFVSNLAVSPALATGAGLDGVSGDPPPIRTPAQLGSLIEVIDDLENRSVAELVEAL